MYRHDINVTGLEALMQESSQKRRYINVLAIIPLQSCKFIFGHALIKISFSLGSYHVQILDNACQEKEEC